MEDRQIRAALEAILFAMGDAVEISSVAAALGCTQEKVLEAAKALEARYEEEGSGLKINRYDDAFQLSTRPEEYEYLIKLAHEPKKPVLTNTLLETLSIIAYRQPVTKLEVEHIRGVNSDFAINRLVSYDLVEEVGRKEAPGRPILFGTTQQFLRSFGIESTDQLPPLDTDQIEELTQQAQEEIDAQLGTEE